MARRLEGPIFAKINLRARVRQSRAFFTSPACELAQRDSRRSSFCASRLHRRACRPPYSRSPAPESRVPPCTHHTQNKAHLAPENRLLVGRSTSRGYLSGNARAQRQQRRDAIERLPPHSWVDFRSRSSSGSGSLFFRSALHPENGTKKGAGGVRRAGSSSVAKSTEIISLLPVCVFWPQASALGRLALCDGCELKNSEVKKKLFTPKLTLDSLFKSGPGFSFVKGPKGGSKP